MLYSIFCLHCDKDISNLHRHHMPRPWFGNNAENRGMQKLCFKEWKKKNSSGLILYSCKAGNIGSGGLRTPYVLACAMRSLAIVITNFRSLSFFFSVFCFWPTSGNLLCAKICFPRYFGITKKYIQIFFSGNFYFFTKKPLIFERFLRPAFGHGRLGHPQF